MRPRELIFAALAAALLTLYLFLGVRVNEAVGPTGAATPTPTAPKATDVPAPRTVPGTIAFVIQGDVYVMRDGKYRAQTAEGRNQQPALSSDGRVVLFSRREEIDGQRILGSGQRVNARLGYASVLSKPTVGGTETMLLDGLRRQDRGGFHAVSWYVAPALSPDGRRLAFLEDDGGGSSDLVLVDLATKRRTVFSSGANLVDTAWSPDGKTIATTTYNTDIPGILLWNVDRPGAAQRVAKLPEGEVYRPTFSADGTWLLYTLRREGRNDVRAIELATSRDVALTSDGRSWNPVASPDGRWVAFLREHGGTIDLYAMDLGGPLGSSTPKESVQLTHGEGLDGASRPAWST